MERDYSVADFELRMSRLLSTLRPIIFATLAVACASSLPQAPTRAGAPAGYEIAEKTLAQLQADLAARLVTSERLVELYAARIHALDASGPTLRAVLALNPHAADDARARDAERALGHVRGPLHGIPVLLKDNIESADPLPTTAGSLALEQNVTGRDAPIVARLREAGAVVLGKSNLSEWANIRSTSATSGWSALGGLTKNPYALERNPCGSSSGSGVAVAANFVAIAVGTETDGSITCPASVLGLVGLKPTLGLISRTRIIPISSMQDTAGPMARTVADAAQLLRVLAGRDDSDPATRDADAHVTDYGAGLSDAALGGRRFGILKFHTGYLSAVDALFQAAVEQLEAAGAEVVVIETFQGLDAIKETELTVLLTDFRTELNAYLSTTPSSVRVRTLADLIVFNRTNAPREMPYFGQELFIRAEATANHDLAEYQKRRDGNRNAAADGLDRLLTENKLDALIAPTLNPAWANDLVNGDHVLGSASMLPAVAGYPHLTVPMGQVDGLPVGLSFIGPAWSDAALLRFGYAYEQRTHLRRPPSLAAHD
jgi:amidase